MNDKKDNFALILYTCSERGPKSPFLLGINLEELKKNITDLVNSHIDDRDDLFLVDVLIKGHEGSRKVTVLIDSDDGINIDECAHLSRKLAIDLDEQELIKGKYLLEVSSPGIDFPLTMTRQYLKNIKRKVRVKLKDGNTIDGNLLEATNSEIRIDREMKVKNKVVFEEEIIPLQKVDQTNVLVTF